MILVLALLFTSACAVASARRLWFVMTATSVDAASVATALAKLPVGARLPLFSSGLAGWPADAWERELVSAFGADEDDRPLLVGEAMTELDFRARRWARVPRVSASLASSFGFLLATCALRVGLSDLAGPLDDARMFSVNSAVLDAIDVAAVGLLGTAFCVAFQYRARSASAARAAGVVRLVELLEARADEESRAFAGDEGRASVAVSETGLTASRC